MSSLSSFTNPIAMSTPFTRSLAIAALMGATMLVSPLTSARADGTTAAILLAQAATTAAAPANSAAKGATEAKGETVEQRITNLHTALKITPDEETNWTGVAQAMRENAAAMQKLAMDRAAQAPESMTAVQDLMGYEKFAKAHFEGLKNLIASFNTLYNAMPDPQKKVADQVFQNYGPKGAAAHS
jgi:protein CpxP